MPTTAGLSGGGEGKASEPTVMASNGGSGGSKIEEEEEV